MQGTKTWRPHGEKGSAHGPELWRHCIESCVLTRAGADAWSLSRCARAASHLPFPSTGLAGPATLAPAATHCQELQAQICTSTIAWRDTAIPRVWLCFHPCSAHVQSPMAIAQALALPGGLKPPPALSWVGGVCKHSAGCAGGGECPGSCSLSPGCTVPVPHGAVGGSARVGVARLEAPELSGLSQLVPFREPRCGEWQDSWAGRAAHTCPCVCVRTCQPDVHTCARVQPTLPMCVCAGV